MQEIIDVFEENHVQSVELRFKAACVVLQNPVELTDP